MYVIVNDEKRKNNIQKFKRADSIWIIRAT